MSIALQEFLARVREIDGERPAYRLGGDGSDGTCDCIGLVIGALRRAGGTWGGVHGSNWAARHEVGNFRPVSSAAGLVVGDIVFTAHEPGDAGYDLPARYANDPDQRDYYHAGVVLSVDPLDIVHCTEPTTKHASKLGKFAFAAELRGVRYDEEDGNMTGTLYRAMVVTEKDPLRVRKAPVTGLILGHVPRGKTVDVIGEGEDGWPLIRFGELEGYASAQYLTRVYEAETGVQQGIGSSSGSGASEGSIVLQRDQAERLCGTAEEMLSQVRALLGLDVD